MNLNILLIEKYTGSWVYYGGVEREIVANDR